MCAVTSKRKSQRIDYPTIRELRVIVTDRVVQDQYDRRICRSFGTNTKKAKTPNRAPTPTIFCSMIFPFLYSISLFMGIFPVIFSPIMLNVLPQFLVCSTDLSFQMEKRPTPLT